MCVCVCVCVVCLYVAFSVLYAVSQPELIFDMLLGPLSFSEAKILSTLLTVSLSLSLLLSGRSIVLSLSLYLPTSHSVYLCHPPSFIFLLFSLHLLPIYLP